MAASLTAQQLSFGPLAQGAGQSKTLNVLLTSQGASLAGVQFDVTYNTTALTVSIALGSSSITAQANLAGCGWPSGVGPATCSYTGIVGNNNPPSGFGQRAIIIGCCATNQTMPTANVIADGVVAVLTITPTSSANSGNQTITLTNAAGTGTGGNNVAPVSYTPMSVSNGTVNLYTTYLVGDVYPFTSDSAPGFGNTPPSITLTDLIYSLFVITSAPGYPAPAACSDRLDAMETFPLDTPTTRGGGQGLSLNDLIVELFRETNAPGYTNRPVRTSLGGVCPSTTRTAEVVRRPAEVQGTLALGPAEGAGTAQERVPVYLQAGRDLTRAAVAFSLGDQQSQLRFEAAPGLPPSLMQDSQPGLIGAAWLGGLNVPAGQRILLGYVVGPAGSAANLKVFGTSATGLNDNQEIGLDVSAGR
jgi:hypothetical protein